MYHGAMKNDVFIGSLTNGCTVLLCPSVKASLLNPTTNKDMDQLLLVVLSFPFLVNGHLSEREKASCDNDKLNFRLGEWHS